MIQDAVIEAIEAALAMPEKDRLSGTGPCRRG